MPFPIGFCACQKRYFSINEENMPIGLSEALK